MNLSFDEDMAHGLFCQQKLSIPVKEVTGGSGPISQLNERHG